MPRAPGPNAFLFIFITILINMIGFGVIMPVMPDLIMAVTDEPRSAAARWGGIMSAIYAVMQFVMAPILGALSDRYGRRPVILVSMIAYALDFLLLALAPTLAILILARVLSGAFAATFTTANAYIADITPPEKRAQSFGMLGAAFGLGFIIGPLIGGVIGDAYGARAPFFFVSALGALNFVYGFLVLPETLTPEIRRNFSWGRANAFGSFKQFSQYPIILPIALAIFIYQVGHWTFPSVWAYFAGERFGWSAREIAYSLAAVGLSAAIVQGGLIRFIVPKIGERRAAIFGLGLATLVYPAYGLAPEGWMIYAIMPFGALVGLALPALQGIMSRTIPANAQGELQGAIASLNGLSMIIGPYLMTQVFGAFTQKEGPVHLGPFMISADGAPTYMPGAPFILAGSLTLLAVLVLFSAFNRIQRPRDEASAATAEEATPAE